MWLWFSKGIAFLVCLSDGFLQPYIRTVGWMLCYPSMNRIQWFKKSFRTRVPVFCTIYGRMSILLQDFFASGWQLRLGMVCEPKRDGQVGLRKPPIEHFLNGVSVGCHKVPTGCGVSITRAKREFLCWFPIAHSRRLQPNVCDPIVVLIVKVWAIANCCYL